VLHLQPNDAIFTTDKLIATQRSCHENLRWYYKHLFKK